MRFDMNHLKELAEKLDYKPESKQHADNLAAYCNSDRVIAICEAYAALEAQVKDLTAANSRLVSKEAHLKRSRSKLEAELARRDAQEPDAEIKWNGSELSVQNVRDGFSFGITKVYAEPRLAAPEGWEVCSPEWIERNGPCSCAEAPRIAFGEVGPHYHPAVTPDKVLPYPSNDKEEQAYARGYNDAIDKSRQNQGDTKATPNKIVDALKKCDWTGVSIGDKVVIQAAVEALSGQPRFTAKHPPVKHKSVGMHSTIICPDTLARDEEWISAIAKAWGTVQKDGK